jgi:nitroreductase
MATSDASDMIEVLRGLRQTRSYSSEPVSDEVLTTILEVAQWTGSGGNKQPWRLVVVRNADTRKQISALKADTGWVADAPVVIGVVTAGKTPESSRFDAGRLVERMMLAARAQGLVAAVIGFGAADSEPAVAARSLLNVPEDLWITHAVVVGHPGPKDKDPGSKKSGRKSLAEIVVQERFSSNS